MLFKYCDADRAIGNLQTGRIRFSQPSVFNDPFELHPKFQLMSSEDIAELPPAVDENGNTIEGQRQLTMEAVQRMLLAVSPHLSRTVVDDPGTLGGSRLISNNAVGREYYDRNFGILSLSADHDNLLMWAHYADQHRGVVIGLDDSHTFFGGQELFPGLARLNQVEYNLVRPVLSPTTQNTPQVFLRKSPEWSYESEWRVIRPLSEAADIRQHEGGPLYLFDLPHDAVRTVITGVHMPPEKLRSLVELLQTTPSLSHVAIHHMQLSDDEYRLKTVPALTEEERNDSLRGTVPSARPFRV